ncbi:MAG: ATP-grasp domain-containing protein [Coriobacteriia bacterium]|nr:ATP-grasp domain-containing protein [Coriobacteriia bacterium]MCL2750861.1 ATP-grasp domain-containing protein [Coriobacteriia bacterium]
MQLLIYEHSYSTGSTHSLAEAGITMFHSLCKAFSVIPEVHILTVEPGVQKPMHQLDSLKRALAQCDATLLVAPEWDGILLRLTQLAESMHKRLLCSPSAAIAISSNKQVCYDRWRQMGLPTPRTFLWHKEVHKTPSFDLSPPLVLKPNCGAGGESTEKVNDIESLDSLVVGNKGFLLQEYIEGEALSVSCLVRDGEVIPITLNRQFMEENGFSCDSVQVLKNDAREAELFALAQAACLAVPHLRGLVGIDLVYGDDGPVLMEINARVTLAFPAMCPEMQSNVVRFLLS